jgi:hypothetical protein
MENTYYVIAISFGQNTEYWNSSLVNDGNTTKNAESAEGFETNELAETSLENFVKPYGISKGWNVTYSVDEV